MISCILLAAGSSSRFGSPKALARLGPETVIGVIQDKLLKLDLAEIVVVLGADSRLIEPHILKDPRIRTIHNKDYALGQTSSFKAGVAGVARSSSGIMLLPVDMPMAKTKTLNLLTVTFLKKKPLILVPVYKGRKGHPPIFSISLLEEFKEMKNSEPVSLVQHGHEEETLKLSVDDEGIVLSFNTPQDLKKLAGKLNG